MENSFIKILNKEKWNYKIFKHKNKVNKIELFNNSEAVLMYYLDSYINSVIKMLFFVGHIEYYYVKNIIMKIEKDMGYYCNCNNNEEKRFWNNLNKCIIVYPSNLEKFFKKSKNEKNNLNIFINEKLLHDNIYNLI